MKANFERWVKKPVRGKPKSIFSELEVDEQIFSDKPFIVIYRSIYNLQKKYGKEFEYMKIKNGIVVKRVK